MDYQILTTAQLSSHLRSLRKARNLTQAQLGARVALSQSRIGKIERSPAQVNIGELLKILAVLGVRVVLQGPTKQTAPASKAVANSSDW